MYLTLHIDAAVYKADKYKAKCTNANLFTRSYFRLCQRRLQQIVSALTFIGKAKDKLKAPITGDSKQKIEFVQRVLAGEKYARYVEKLQEPPDQKTMDHPMLAVKNIVDSLWQLQDDEQRDAAIERIQTVGARPTDEPACAARGRRAPSQCRALAGPGSRRAA